jgi:transposase
MRSAASGIALALLTGCQTVMTPRSIIDQGTRSTHALHEEPHRAAVCMARNIDRRMSALTAQIRPGISPVLVEVHVRAGEIVSLAHFLISGDGSTAVIWTTSDPLYHRDDLIGAMIAGC